MKVNRHGNRITNLREISGNSKPRSGSGCANGIYYRKDSGEMFIEQFVGSSAPQFMSDNVIYVTSTKRHLTMQEISDSLAHVLADLWW